MHVILLMARLLLAMTFAVAGAAKLADPVGSRQSILEFGAPAFLARPLSWLLPLVELGCAIALVPLASAWWGAGGVLVLLLLFIAVISISLARGRRPDCHCFGQLHSSPVGWKTLARNVVLAGMAAFVVWQGPENQGASVVSLLSVFQSAAPVFVIAIAGLAAFQIWALFHLLRQNGRLLLRLEAVEAKVGMSAAVPPPLGLPVESVAPGFTLSGLDGRTVTLDILREAGRPLLLLFTEPGCGACDALLPEVGGWQREHADRLVIALISRGPVEANRTKSAEHHLRNVLLQTDRETAQAYQAEGTPSAVLVKDGQIASPLAAGADAIRALIVKATLPPPLGKGSPAPSLKLPDLNGKTIDIATLRGRRTLLLFWNPSCGFCQQMFEDVKSWERHSAVHTPKMVIISTGSVEANRAQGFRSLVLLDQNFVAGQVFGVGGTPSALMLDDAGRVASDVAVGAPGVLALTGEVPVGERA